MPRVNKINSVPVVKRGSADIVSKRINSARLIKDDGVHLTSDLKINYVTKFALSFVDKIAPVINKYPKFGKVIVSVCEKFINKSGKLSK